ncbi:uncharacterized protein C1orf131 homolog [Puntigrus tetrazona]|uniref:uncharacterized protein C1orf131 homolog n=1 Tax=Puntigrus tetrazona TaxID=1606681 RepID=UPI001C89DE8A|nr:uncharacterized protein C1orf131 homolog [Puntigrus tetrazona]
MSVTTVEHGGEVDDDHLFLDQVLNKLYDFGDRKNKRLGKSQKRKNSSKDDVKDTEGDTETACHGTDSEQLLTNSGTKRSDVEVVTFIDPLKKSKLSKAVEPRKKVSDVKEKQKNGSDEKLTIEKARFEVHKLGLSGYQKQQQRVFEQDRAIMLGAIPPKKQYVNYKVYQQRIQEQKTKAEEEAKSEPQQKRKKEWKPRAEKSKSSGGELGGQVGRFKNGMLMLSSKDIHKFKVKVKK